MVHSLWEGSASAAARRIVGAFSQPLADEELRHAHRPRIASNCWCCVTRSPSSAATVGVPQLKLIGDTWSALPACPWCWSGLQLGPAEEVVRLGAATCLALVRPRASEPSELARSKRAGRAPGSDTPADDPDVGEVRP